MEMGEYKTLIPAIYGHQMLVQQKKMPPNNFINLTNSTDRYLVSI